MTSQKAATTYLTWEQMVKGQFESLGCYSNTPRYGVKPNIGLLRPGGNSKPLFGASRAVVGETTWLPSAPRLPYGGQFLDQADSNRYVDKLEGKFLIETSMEAFMIKHGMKGRKGDMSAENKNKVLNIIKDSYDSLLQAQAKANFESVMAEKTQDRPDDHIFDVKVKPKIRNGSKSPQNRDTDQAAADVKNKARSHPAEGDERTRLVMLTLPKITVLEIEWIMYPQFTEPIQLS